MRVCAAVKRDFQTVGNLRISPCIGECRSSVAKKTDAKSNARKSLINCIHLPHKSWQMIKPDHALEALKRIICDFKAFCTKHGAVIEADTRANLIDRVLTEVTDEDKSFLSSFNAD